jgi:hypothetical protein
VKVLFDRLRRLRQGRPLGTCLSRSEVADGHGPR